MSAAFGIEPRPPEWPKKTTYECPYCEGRTNACSPERAGCRGSRQLPTLDYGPTMSAAWSSWTISDLVRALGLPCEEFPCSWPLETFRAAIRDAGPLARASHAFASVSTWLSVLEELRLAPETVVYVA